jgi:hypothetical protein
MCCAQISRRFFKNEKKGKCCALTFVSYFLGFVAKQIQGLHNQS